MINGFISDSDGVIIDSELYHDRIQRDMLAAFGKVYERDLVKPLIAGQPAIMGARFLVERYNLPISPEEFNKRRKEIRKEAYKNDIPFVPGFEDFYKKLIDAFPFPVAIATGCERDDFDSIDKRLGLNDMFNGHVYFSDMVENPKPAPDIYLLAAKMIGIPAKDCCVFEDAPNGIVAAMRAGAKVVALTRTFEKELLLRNASDIMGEQIKEEKLLIIPGYDPGSIEKVIDYLKKD